VAGIGFPGAKELPELGKAAWSLRGGLGGCYGCHYD